MHIRTEVFRLTQTAFAALVGVSQTTISRWERGELEPSQSDLATIRSAARSRGLDWHDSWLFERPTVAPDGASAFAAGMSADGPADQTTEGEAA